MLAVRDDEGTLSQPIGGALGRLAGNVGADACRVGRHERIYEGREEIAIDGVDYSLEPHVPKVAVEVECLVLGVQIDAPAWGESAILLYFVFKS